MRKNTGIHTLTGLIACLMLVSCTAQTVDEPIPTFKSNGTTITFTSLPAFTADDTLSVTTTGLVETIISIVTPRTTGSQDVPTTGSMIKEIPVTSNSATDSSTTSVPMTEKPETSASSTPTTSEPPPETTTALKTAVSRSKQTITTTQTLGPMPHTHSWSGWKVAQAATCTEDGSQRRTCSGCNEVQTQAIPAIGHSFGAWKVLSEPTTEKTGVEQRTCTSCGINELRSIEILNPEISSVDTEWMAQRFLELLNQERTKVGSQKLVTSDKLHEMAQVRTDELTVLFDHVRPDGRPISTIFDDFQYGIYYDDDQAMSYSYQDSDGNLQWGLIHYLPAQVGSGGEDIEIGGYWSNESLEEFLVWMMDGFRESPGHWSDMMNNVYGAVGVAVSVVKHDGDSGIPDLYDCYIEILLVDRLYETT